MSDESLPTCNGPDPNPRKPKLDVPEGACDCHAHILGPLSDYPYAQGRSYDPPEALLESYRHMLATLWLTRAVIVQPSVYGTDNRATLAAIETSNGAFRGVAVVEADVDDKALAELHERGIRGLRINPMYPAAAGLSDCPNLSARLKDLGWHLQIFVDVSTLDQDDFALLDSLDVPLVFDHMGYMAVGKGLGNTGFQWLLERLNGGRVWVKLSGAYYLGEDPPPRYLDVAPFAKALVAANPARCLWASNWPHPNNGKAMANDGELLDLLADWAPDPAVRHQILVDNPAALYGFQATEMGR